MEEIPSEIYVGIFELLKFAGWYQVALVCKAWRAMLEASLLFQRCRTGMRYLINKNRDKFLEHMNQIAFLGDIQTIRMFIKRYPWDSSTFINMIFHGAIQGSKYELLRDVFPDTYYQSLLEAAIPMSRIDLIITAKSHGAVINERCLFLSTAASGVTMYEWILEYFPNLTKRHKVKLVWKAMQHKNYEIVTKFIQARPYMIVAVASGAANNDIAGIQAMVNGSYDQQFWVQVINLVIDQGQITGMEALSIIIHKLHPCNYPEIIEHALRKKCWQIVAYLAEQEIYRNWRSSLIYMATAGHKKSILDYSLATICVESLRPTEKPGLLKEMRLVDDFDIFVYSAISAPEITWIDNRDSPDPPAKLSDICLPKPVKQYLVERLSSSPVIGCPVQ
jgi:hypothetical protein